MLSIREGQCGTCAHFGEDAGAGNRPERLIEIASKREAPENLVETCGQHQDMALKVSPIGACKDFLLASAAHG